MRWKLTEPHYLNVPGTRWEQVLTDRSTGRPVRKVYDVPLFLHPESPMDWTHKDARGEDGYIVVCHAGKGNPEDIVFVGSPTPGMLPLDDEARALTATFAKSWTPTAGTDEQAQLESFSQKLLNGMFEQIAVAQTSTAALPAAPGMEKFMEMFGAMMQQQTAILAAISSKIADVEFAKAGKALGEIPVVDEAEPLPEAEPTAEEVREAALAAHENEVASTAKAQAHMERRRI